VLNIIKTLQSSTYGNSIKEFKTCPIKNDITGEVLYEISGMWSGEMSIKNVKVSYIL